MEIIDVVEFFDMETIIFIGIMIVLGAVAWYVVDVYLGGN